MNHSRKLEERMAAIVQRSKDPEGLKRRHAVLTKRAERIAANPRIKRAFLFSDQVAIQIYRKHYGPPCLPSELFAKDPEGVAWGEWQRDQKRAVDAALEGFPPKEIRPFPPVPSWFEWNPGIRKLAAELGIEAPQ